jgi:hypothetical protein
MSRSQAAIAAAYDCHGALGYVVAAVAHEIRWSACLLYSLSSMKTLFTLKCQCDSDERKAKQLESKPE